MINRGICYGVSVGPGKGELITLEAINVIEKADIVFLPSFPKEECKAYQIIKSIMPEIDKKDIQCETFTMSKESSVAKMRHQEIFANAKSALDTGKNIAFLTLGEVGLYSTYLYIHEMLCKEGYESILINGISSVQAISARLGKPLALGDEQVHIFPDAENMDYYLSFPGMKVFMKPKGNIKEMVSAISKYVEKNTGSFAYGVSNCGMANEIIANSVDELDSLAGYFTVIFVGGGDIKYEPTSRYFENRSCKYYPCHKGSNHINCLFCYCPMYRFENCLGNPKIIESKGRKIKDCSDCTFAHNISNYDAVMDFLKNQ